MFSTEGQEVKGGGLGKSFNPGVVYAHIYSAAVKTSQTGKKSLEITLEGPAINGFEGWALDKENPEGAKFAGQTARVSATVYTTEFNSDDINKNEILNKIIIISNELGLRKEIDSLSKDGSITSIEQWVEAAVDVLRGQDAYWFLAGKEDEYNGKVITKLSLPKYKFCSVDESKIPKFDKTNKYHFTPLASKAVTSFEANDFEM